MFLVLAVLPEVVFGQSTTASTAKGAPSRNERDAVPSDELTEARSLVEGGALVESERVVRRYLATHPTSADAHFLCGYILFRQVQAGATQQGSADNNKTANEKIKASLAEYTEGAKYHVPGAFDLKVVALNYVLLGDYGDADKWLTKSLEMGPGDPDSWYYLGRAKYAQNRFEEAVHAFQQCLKLSPKNVKAEDNLGLAYAGLARNQEAITAYQTAIQWQADVPNKDPGPYVNLGSLLIDTDRAEESVSYLVRAVEAAPAHVKAHELLGRAYERLSQPDKAQVELEKAVELAPKNAALHYQLGQVYRKRGLKEKAKAEFDLASTLSAARSTSQTAGR